MSHNISELLETHDELEWSRICDLRVGEAYQTSVDSPLTFVMLGKFYGRNGRPEYDVTTIVGPNQGRASTRTYFRGEKEVLVVPPAEVGSRVAHAAVAFSDRNFRGHEIVQLGRDCWPLSLIEDDHVAVVEDEEVSA